jgi:hypothetical protein
LGDKSSVFYILSIEGYNVETFTNPKEALKRFLEASMDNNNNNDAIKSAFPIVTMISSNIDDQIMVTS